MSDNTETDSRSEGERSGSSPNLGMQNTPNAERYVLAADAMRRRQLRSALLHGSGRTWREYPRMWIKVCIGAIVVAVVLAGLAVTEAFNVTQENQHKKEEQQKEQKKEQQREQEKQQREQEKQQKRQEKQEKQREQEREQRQQEQQKNQEDKPQSLPRDLSGTGQVSYRI